MKKITIIAAAAALIMTCGCGNTPAESSSSSETPSTSAAEETAAEEATTEEAATETAEHATAPQQEVGYEGMAAVHADELNEGTYHISVDSSSSMFKIADCILTVNGEDMTADLIIASKSYDALFMGSEDDAETADDSALIKYTENDEGQSVFTVPVNALDEETECAALSAKKQEWYGRTLVFRADSLPENAFRESRYTAPDSLSLADGKYTADVKLEGGSGKATVESPAVLTVKNGQVTAEVIWSSSNYDYMIVDGEKYLPTNTEGNSTFSIPVKGFDYKMPVSADTTAMSVQYEIEYTLYFDSASIAPKTDE